MSYVKQNDIWYEWWLEPDISTNVSPDSMQFWTIYSTEAFCRNRIEENKKAYKYKPRYEHARARKKRLAKEAAEGYTIDFNCLI